MIRKLASSGVLFRLGGSGDGKVMRVATGLMDARARLHAVADLASEAWAIILNGHALPTIDPALEADPDDDRPARGRANGHSNGHVNGHANGHSNGHVNGHANGSSNGHVNGHANGHSNGHVNGSSNGYANGHSNGHVNGHSNGHSNGHVNGHSNGHANGASNGHTNGALHLAGLNGLSTSGAASLGVVTEPRRPAPAPSGDARALSEEIASRTSLAKIAGRDVFEKCHRFTTADNARKMGVYPYFRAFDFNNGPEAQFEGRTITMLGSNNYLGLTTHPKVREAARSAIDKYGTSMTGSRLVNGTMKLHKELEERLAAYHGKEAGLVFTTGYQVNLAVISALLSNKKTVAVADKDVHASAYDGIRLSQANGARLIRFKHNDPDALEQALSRLEPDEGALVITEGVFGAQGEIGKLREVVRIAKEHGARVFIDDAHGAGVLGPNGRGTPAHLGVSDQVDLIGGTFSKSFASIGGWLVGDRKVLDYIQHFAHSFLFAASAAPPSVAAAMASLEVMQEEPWRQDKLRENFTYMRKELVRLGFDVGKTETAIIPIFVRDDLKAMMMGKVLLDEFGVYANVFITPGVPPKQQALRTSYMATHERHHLDRALEAFEKVGKRFGVI